MNFGWLTTTGRVILAMKDTFARFFLLLLVFLTCTRRYISVFPCENLMEILSKRDRRLDEWYSLDNEWFEEDFQWAKREELFFESN